ncbi:Lipoprotein signal peptidase [gamma proteobacterium IMCC1989]|nr:Lipoprotein signal peptidase [gamma proteobacterium IMCC1989]
MLNLLMKNKLSISQPKKKLVWFGLALMIVVADQLTKSMATAALTYAEPVAFLPYFNFTLLHNYGAAFSFLSDAGGWQRIFLGVVAFAVSVFLVFWILCINSEKKIEILGLSLVLGGAIGNLWDRIYLGYVVDFIDWFYITANSDCLSFFYFIFSSQSCHWPAFNIADAAIMLGAACLIIDMLFFEPRKNES